VIPLDTKHGATVWVFSEFFPADGVIRGDLAEVRSGRAYMHVSRKETEDEFPFHEYDLVAVYLTEADATAAYAAWLFKRGEQIAAELHENEKKFWVAKQRVHDLKNGAQEREMRS